LNHVDVPARRAAVEAIWVLIALPNAHLLDRRIARAIRAFKKVH